MHRQVEAECNGELDPNVRTALASLEVPDRLTCDPDLSAELLRGEAGAFLPECGQLLPLLDPAVALCGAQSLQWHVAILEMF